MVAEADIDNDGRSFVMQALKHPKYEEYGYASLEAS